jgi:hypothetical protein
VIGRCGSRKSASAKPNQIATADKADATADHVEFIIGRAYPPCFKFRPRQEFLEDESLYDGCVTVVFDHCMMIILQYGFGARISMLRRASKRILLFFSGADGAATYRIPSPLQG